MSNVLMGIIGVILFIGLALAGALFLGTRFQAATNDSRAAAVVQAVSQVAQASAMAMASGAELVTSSDPAPQLVARGYLKSVPLSPVSADRPTLLAATSGRSDGTERPDVVVMFMGTETVGSDGDRVCMAIGRQTGQITTPVETSPRSTAVPAAQAGCFRKSGRTGNMNDASFFANARI